MSENAYLAAAAANKQDFPALPDLESAIADFKEWFQRLKRQERLASSKCAQTRVGRRGRVTKNATERVYKLTLQKRICRSSRCMSKASFELGEEPKKENKTATQKQTLNSRKDMVQWQNMGYSKKTERRVAFCCNDSVELGAWVEGIRMSIPKNLGCLRTNQPLFSSNFIFCWKPDTPNSRQTGLGIPFFWQNGPAHFPSHRISHFIFSEHRTWPISINANMPFPFFYNGLRISKQYCNRIHPHTQFFSNPKFVVSCGNTDKFHDVFFFGSFWQTWFWIVVPFQFQQYHLFILTPMMLGDSVPHMCADWVGRTYTFSHFRTNFWWSSTPFIVCSFFTLSTTVSNFQVQMWLELSSFFNCE